MEFNKAKMEVATKAIGLTMNNTVMEPKRSRMVQHMLDSTLMAWNTAKESLPGQIRVLMKVLL